MKRFIDGNFKRGFSLAEALITLLIVCLITLATIPVLTKKKRDLNSAGHGVWMCTRNIAGQYVYYSKEAENGDPNNPETWTPTGKDSCEFKAPPQVRNFSVIAVGGGGGGGNGDSNFEVKASTNGDEVTKYFTPSVSGFYDVMLIGAGGGGGDGQSSDTNMGGGGGSGGMFQGYIPLFSDVSYKLVAGGGGSNGGSDYHGGSSDSTSHGWASGGKEHSYFQSTNAPSQKRTSIVATVGGGGEGVGCSKWKCRGGSGVGGGGGVSENVYVSSYAFGDAPSRKSEVTFSAGKSGSPGVAYYNNGNPFPWGGKSNYKNPSGQVLPYGNGGNGGGQSVLYNSNGDKMYSTRYSFSGQYGANGFVMVSQNVRKFGKGGSAAQPVQQFVPSISGKLVVKIADAALAGQSGGSTVVQFVNSKLNDGQRITAFGGTGGTVDTVLSVPTNGENSKWTNNGGGLAAEACQPKKWIPAGSSPQTIKVLTCKKIECTLASSVTESMFLQVSNKNGTTVDGVTTPKYPAPVENGKTPNDYNLTGETSSKPVPPSFPAYKTSDNITNYLTDILKIKDYLIKEYGSFNTTDVKNNKMKYVNSGDESKTDFAAYENSTEIYNNYACYSDVNIQYSKDCTETEYKNKTVASSTEGSWAPASCDKDGGNGTHIGAGGGGGNAGETAGIASKGGKGGYGGVIIEW